jgi:Holliday junction resolvase RusA-like endonuclease
MANKSGKNIVLFSNKVNIKPLSVNEAWQGKRFKSKKYQAYELELLYTLPPTEINWDKKPIELTLIVGLSNMQSDIDNVVKPFVDVLQKKYKFNDRYIYRLIVEKNLVEKGAEFIEFHIKTLIPSHYLLAE